MKDFVKFAFTGWGVVLIEKFDHMSLIEKLEKFEVENFFLSLQ